MRRGYDRAVVSRVLVGTDENGVRAGARGIPCGVVAGRGRQHRTGAMPILAIRSGPFLGIEGFILRRHGQVRLLVAVDFLQQGASVLLDECEVEPR